MFEQCDCGSCSLNQYKSPLLPSDCYVEWTRCFETDGTESACVQKHTSSTATSGRGPGLPYLGTVTLLSLSPDEKKPIRYCIAEAFASREYGRSGLTNLYIYHGRAGSHQCKCDAHFISHFLTMCALFKSDLFTTCAFTCGSFPYCTYVRWWWRNVWHFFLWKVFFFLHLESTRNGNALALSLET